MSEMADFERKLNERIAQARLLEHALHGGPDGWTVVADTCSAPMRRVIIPEEGRIVLYGVLPKVTFAPKVELRYQGELLAVSELAHHGPCAVRWEVGFGAPIAA